MKDMKALAAEFLGTFWLVLGGCGSAVFAARYFTGTGADRGDIGIGLLGVSLAFGLTVVTGAYAFGHISGGHFNPAVTLGLVAGGKFSPAKVPQYIGAQLLGALASGLVIYSVWTGGGNKLEVSGKIDPETGIAEGAGAFATNGYGEFSPGGYDLTAVATIEVVLTALFIIVILGATAKKAAAGFGGLAIGLTLALIHLISIPISNTSVNPARSTSQAVVSAIFGDGDASGTPLSQLAVFWIAPIAGAVLGGLIYRTLLDTDDEVVAEAA